MQIAEQAAAEDQPSIPTFEAYTEEWFQIYKVERIKKTTAGGYIHARAESKQEAVRKVGICWPESVYQY